MSVSSQLSSLFGGALGGNSNNESGNNDDEQEFDAVINALVQMPAEAELPVSNPLGNDESLGRLFEMMIE